MTERARWWWGTAPIEIRGESTKQYSRQTPGFFGGGRCSRPSGWTPEARSRICVCRASFLMTFVQSGMPHRIPAHDQCMLSHDNGCGNPACQDTVRKQWNKLKAERNLHGSLYSLRHTFISIVSSQTHLAEGTIKDLVGHSKDFQTFDVYKHRVDGEIENAGRIINLTFERLKSAQ